MHCHPVIHGPGPHREVSVLQGQPLFRLREGASQRKGGANRGSLLLPKLRRDREAGEEIGWASESDPIDGGDANETGTVPPGLIRPHGSDAEAGHVLGQVCFPARSGCRPQGRV